MPHGWLVKFEKADVSKKASINIYHESRRAVVKLDNEIFDDPNVPEGVKVFMIFHEIGHLIYGPAEEKCDRFAFYHSLAAGVSPFLCYIAIRAYMPSHYGYRIAEMFNNLMDNVHLKNDVK